MLRMLGKGSGVCGCWWMLRTARSPQPSRHPCLVARERGLLGTHACGRGLGFPSPRAVTVATLTWPPPRELHARIDGDVEQVGDELDHQADQA